SDSSGRTGRARRPRSRSSKASSLPPEERWSCSTGAGATTTARSVSGSPAALRRPRAPGNPGGGGRRGAFAPPYAPRAPPRAPADVIAEVGLVEKTRARVAALSGGQKQRLAVACALVGDPELLFLDEPTTGLDPQSRRQVWDIVNAFKARGRTVLLTTHYMDEAERLCDRIAVVDHGRVIAKGTPRELVRSL